MKNQKPETARKPREYNTNNKHTKIQTRNPQYQTGRNCRRKQTPKKDTEKENAETQTNNAKPINKVKTLWEMLDLITRDQDGQKWECNIGTCDKKHINQHNITKHQAKARPDTWKPVARKPVKCPK